MAQSDIIEALQRTRDGYVEECEWHLFLLHAYGGTGGFAGKIVQPDVGYFGWESQTYTSVVGDLLGTKTESYLDRFPREDSDKFNARCDVAHYSNYIEPILDTLLSYIGRRESNREGLADSVKEWLDNADGAGKPWQTLQREVIDRRTALFGYCPVLFDKPRAEPDKPRAQQAEVDSPRAIPLLPLNLLDYSSDDKGNFNWVKLRISYVEHDDPLAKPKQVQRYQLWFPDRWQQYIVRKDENGNETVEGPEEAQHNFGSVPLVIFQRKQAIQNTVLGVSLVASPAIKARRMFNLDSEFDEHLRSTVFAFLQVPVDPNAKDIDAKKVIGSGNALTVPYNATQGYAWIAPPESIATTYEVRIQNTINEMLRMGYLGFTRSVGSVESGEARKWRFEQTNSALIEFAAQLARAEQKSLKLVGRMLGVSEDQIEQQRVTSPENFGVEDIGQALDNAIKAAGLPGISPTAEMQITLRALQRLLPNLPSDEWAEVEEELRSQRDIASAARSMDREMQGDGEPPGNESKPE